MALFHYITCPICKTKVMVVSSTLRPAMAVLHCGHVVGSDKDLSK